MSTNDLFVRPAGSLFKHDEPSRVDERIEQDRQAAATERLYLAEIDTRDKRVCRACDKRSDPDATGLLRGHRHHIVYRSAGGSDEASNRVTLCATCHNDEHKNRLRFSEDGDHRHVDANTPMEFWRKDAAGAWFLSWREVQIGQAERD